jgi:nucleotidyltransferase/DNA polymerase involved in DNA repair
VEYVLYCRLPNFYVQLFELGEDRPAAVIRDKVVLDSNHWAAKRGVVPGMALSQAKTILREDGLFRALKAEDGEKEQLEWLELCTKVTGVIEPEDRHSAYLDLSAHPKPFDVAQRFLEKLARLSGCEARFGVGASKWLARLSADNDGERLTPLDASWLAEFSVSQLTPIAPEHRERLRFLGYHFAGQIAELPMAVLRGQFGDEALRIQLAAKGTWKDPVQALYPPDTLSERLIFDGACDHALIVDQALVSIARRIGRRLAKKEQQATEVRLTLELEDGETRTLTRRFNKPLRCARTALASLRLLFGEGVGVPIAGIGVKLPSLEPVRCTQQNLMGVLNKVEADHLADSALRQLRSVYGETSIQVAGQVAQPRRVRVLQEWKNATGWR